MSQIFKFEADFAESLRCIPMQVRYKLDTCGVKLKLSHWNHLSPEERQTLVHQPCATATEIQDYRAYLHQSVNAHMGEIPSDLPIDPHPDWLDEAIVPESVREQGKSVGVQIDSAQWASLTPLQRFALIKLSRSQHENKNFLPALREFSIA
jgi:hypothetical protein